jgi:peptidoglycan LD-endopeptidase CwlK
MKFSKSSQRNLETCHPKLQELFNEVTKSFDCTVICGHRTREQQDLAFTSGKSKTSWPMSKHNQQPSQAVDVCPTPLDWNNRDAFYHFAGFVRATAIHLGIKIRWGGDWDGNFNLKDQNFFDLPHFELEP